MRQSRNWRECISEGKDLKRAELLAVEAVQICEKFPEYQERLDLDHLLGQIEQHRSDFGSAQARLEASIEAARNRDDANGLGLGLHQLGGLKFQNDQTAEGARLLYEAIEVKENAGDYFGAAKSSIVLASGLLENNLLKEAALVNIQGIENSLKAGGDPEQLYTLRLGLLAIISNLETSDDPEVAALVARMIDSLG